MKAREAKRLLKCSYTTLHNYVKQGRIKAIDVGKKNTQYDGDSVQKLAVSLFGNDEPKFKVSVTKNGNVSVFMLDEHIVNRILDYIIFELKNNEVEGMKDDQQEVHDKAAR